MQLTVDPEQAIVTVNGEPFATVHHAAEPRPYIWPLYAPGGVPVTRDFPMGRAGSGRSGEAGSGGEMGGRPGEQADHPHHQSFWFAHGNVDGFDFWHGKGHRERIVLSSDGFEGSQVGDTAWLRVCYDWVVDDDTVVARERRHMVFADRDDHRTIDVTISLRPGADQVTFGDTKEGTFAMRVHPALRVSGKVATGTLRNSEGATGKAVWGKRARWIDDSGIVDGKPVGIVMFDHPDNPRHPTHWHARTYGLLAANPFGVHDFEKKPKGTGNYVVKRGEVLTLRYRVLLHGDGWDDARIEAAFARWARGE